MVWTVCMKWIENLYREASAGDWNGLMRVLTRYGRPAALLMSGYAVETYGILAVERYVHNKMTASTGRPR